MSYGTDTWCAPNGGLRTGRLVAGVTLIAQALARRFSTPRGVLRGGDEESAYGLDVSNYVGAVGTIAAAAALPNIMRAEALKDDRISSVRVETALDPNTDSLTITMHVTPGDETAPFTLTLAASAVEVQLLGTGTP